MRNERYYKGNVLNKWFAISSILFFISIILTFIDDNDDEFKEYQKEFRSLEVQTSKDQLVLDLEKVKQDRILYEEKLVNAQQEFNNNNALLIQAQKDSAKLNGKFYKANAEFLAFKGLFDQIKFDTTLYVGAEAKKFEVDKIKDYPFTTPEIGLRPVVKFYTEEYMEKA